MAGVIRMGASEADDLQGKAETLSRSDRWILEHSLSSTYSTNPPRGKAAMNWETETANGKPQMPRISNYLRKKANTLKGTDSKENKSRFKKK